MNRDRDYTSEIEDENPEITFFTCVREVLGSNFGRNTGFPESIVRSSSQLL
jgi:hypothetical protein